MTISLLCKRFMFKYISVCMMLSVRLEVPGSIGTTLGTYTLTESEILVPGECFTQMDVRASI